MKCDDPVPPSFLQVKDTTGEIPNRDYKNCNTHNHELYDEKELVAVPHKWFIPDDIQEKMLDRNQHVPHLLSGHAAD